MDETLDTLGATLKQALAPSVTGHAVAFGELTLHVEAADIVKVATFLRDDPRCRFVCIIDVTAIDWPSREKRFDVVWHFLSPPKNTRTRSLRPKSPPATLSSNPDAPHSPMPATSSEPF